MLRCKFCVAQITREGQGRTLVMSASNQKEGDNLDWSKWTPNGQFSIHVTNKAAFPTLDALNPGDHLFIDLTPVPAE